MASSSSQPVPIGRSKSPPKPRIILNQVMELIQADMSAVNRLIQKRLASDVVLINQLSSYIINSGGKRLRPVCVLLAAKAFGYQSNQHVTLAAIIEFIHTATLLHDDVVDTSEMRRGQETANAIWGNEASVLVGDFLYSRSFEMMVEVGSMRIMEIMSKTTNTIAEGEVMQLLNCHSPDVTEQQYMETIRRKTAKLFESATQLGAVICQQSSETEQAMIRYGAHLGTAFQLVDDALDFSGDSAEIGKNIGDDLDEGKPTLPLITAIENGDARERRIVEQSIISGGKENIKQVIDIVKHTGALDYTLEKAEEQAQQAKAAITAIPDSPYKQALSILADFSVARTF